MFKLLYNCTHFTCQQDYAQNPSSQTSVVHEPKTFRCTSWFQKRQRNQRSNWFQHWKANTHWIILQYTYRHDGTAFLFTTLLPTIPLHTDSYSNIMTVCGPFYLPNCYDSYYKSHELSRKGGRKGGKGRMTRGKERRNKKRKKDKSLLSHSWKRLEEEAPNWKSKR